MKQSIMQACVRAALAEIGELWRCAQQWDAWERAKVLQHGARLEEHVVRTTVSA